MIEFITQKPEIMFTAGGDLKLIFAAPRNELKGLEALPKDKELVVTVKRYHKKRSLDANAYFWKLCDEVAKAIGSTKEAVYRQKIKDVGVFEIVPIRADAVEEFKNRFAKNGIGWFAESLEGSKLEGYQRVMIFFGSSTYNTAEMSRIIEAIIEDCNELGIPTLSTNEIKSLCENYNIE